MMKKTFTIPFLYIVYSEKLGYYRFSDDTYCKSENLIYQVKTMSPSDLYLI